ncbi:tRNA preQ1(34) S-adenosylmethionine ribosyltransferase-isomerase QueA [Patescibacteria group bacterium]|nr:tRNA preQ1(34) S-adenosylmethionine ribosyltransferase-isomerase QueA [Patescibacteria group bacterium]
MNNLKISTNLAEFDYHLPKELIAQKPIRPRDHSRLMILNRKNHSITHDYFYNLGKYLKSNDVLVANDSKVIPARLFGKKPTPHQNKFGAGQAGGKTEILLLKPLKNNCWEIVLKGRGKRGMEIEFTPTPERRCILKNAKHYRRLVWGFSKKLSGILKSQLSDQIWEIEFNLNNNAFIKQIHKLGVAPTPPYIKRLSNLKEYQTIYAQTPGSAAAPTAGFHFTKKLIKKLKKQGIEIEFITLHVGLGTFQPVRTENIEEHQIHAEWGEITRQAAEKLNQAKKNKQRIIAVGTTATRVLEAFTFENKLKPGSRWLNLFIYPGYKFKFVDKLITNFHLPKSSLLMLICAFTNRDLIFQAYQQAIEKKYRFYSFGDALLII